MIFFGHSLLFSVAFISFGIYFLYKKRNSSVLLIGTCSFIHLALDSMWLYSSILFWPYFGLKFPVRVEGDWIQSSIYRLITDPTYFLPEIIGFTIIAYYFIKLSKNKQLMAFIKQGKL